MLLLWCVLASSCCFTRVSLNPLITTEKTSTTWPTNDSLLQIYSAQMENSDVSDVRNAKEFRETWDAVYMRLVDHIMASENHGQYQTLRINSMPNETDVDNYGPREQKKINQVYHNISFPYPGPDERIQHPKRISTKERWDIPFILQQKLKNRGW